ncbi:MULTISPECIES: phosphate ABC transporter substrate-binding protein PstS [unclassified Sphingomonas]|uniref:phosphate ABC transporter substrate-binding protein PstS n=1 Tax=unclassified Sphingomonas TaxID=196159 RepID=UPI0006FF9B37|nr:MULTISPECIES: phosphate ABC transporter substrate-binding protein PstS [unclassified Sphingomonas]KQX19588.1 phosphate ABC transporter substrate-binding protein [Sphingomonas sp. Root1294]KQY65789.1 phosphate ABC transporter substrate-binding protein [Sphingomonas sp. Root50]KRB94906.1 phosphate ABC transporter substrate-binding protein [Sphingomonas sp. Root720]
MFKKFVASLSASLILASGAVSTAHAASISGAGATFPAPLYAKWAETYKATTGIGLNYQAIGSGGGIKQIKAKTVDFGASDKPLKPAELAAAGLYQFPTVMGGVVPIVNLPGIRPGQIKLTGTLLADIFMGRIRKWNDPRIAGLNRGVRLPPLPITVVHRSDGSGTSFLFTSYLAMKNPAWAAKVGASDAVSWPTGIGGKGNDGVSAFVKQTMGSIGYVEYAYAKQNRATFVLLQNKSGQFIAPAAGNFTAAAAGAQWAKAPGNYILLLDQPGAKAWPITGATFILVHRNQPNPATGASVLKFFDWAYKGGDAAALRLDYVPLPAAVKALVRKQWLTSVKAGNKPVYVAR